MYETFPSVESEWLKQCSTWSSARFMGEQVTFNVRASLLGAVGHVGNDDA